MDHFAYTLVFGGFLLFGGRHLRFSLQPRIGLANTDSMTTDSPATVALVCSRFDSLRTEAYRGSESLALMEEAAERWDAK